MVLKMSFLPRHTGMQTLHLLRGVKCSETFEGNDAP